MKSLQNIYGQETVMDGHEEESFNKRRKVKTKLLIKIVCYKSEL